MNRLIYILLGVTLCYACYQAGRWAYEAKAEADRRDWDAAFLRAECADLEQRLALAERRVMAQEQFFFRVASGQFNYAPSVAACMNVMRGYATLASKHYPDSVLAMTPAQIDSALAKDPRSKTAYHWNKR
jgi:hypothetical protein